LSNLSILDEVAQKLKTSSDQIKFRRELAGTSTAKVTEISWGKEKEGILKQNTTKEEWIIYSSLVKKYKLPVPKIIAISKTSEIPWILLEKIPKSIHPKNWNKDNIEAALREVAKINSKFYNNPILDTLEDLPNVNEENWKDIKRNLQNSIKKAIKITESHKGKTPLTTTNLETVRKDINSKDFLVRFLAAGRTLIHGGTWTYNFLQTSTKTYLLDWQESMIASPALDFVHFYDFLPIHAEGFRVRFSERPFTLEELQDIYFDELEKNKVKINKTKFKQSLKASISFQIAHIWAPMLKPDVILLRGGRYFIARSLRLWPSRKTMRQHYTDLMEIRKKK